MNIHILVYYNVIQEKHEKPIHFIYLNFLKMFYFFITLLFLKYIFICQFKI